MEEDLETQRKRGSIKRTLMELLYIRESTSATATHWDHDHCELCIEKFAETDLIPEALHEGYATLDNYRWICASCFNDFREKFAWTLAELEE